MSVTAIASSSLSVRSPTVKPLTPITAWAIAKRPIGSMRSLPAKECGIRLPSTEYRRGLTRGGVSARETVPAALPRHGGAS